MTTDNPDQQNDRPGLLRRFARGARDRTAGTIGAVTGAQYRRQFEEFTDAVTTTVVAVHQDQVQFKKRAEELEAAHRDHIQRLEGLETAHHAYILRIQTVGVILGAGVLSALLLGVIALWRTF